MSAQKRNFSLMIHGGLHDGAEIAFPVREGTMNIGSDPDCDVVLLGDPLADKHLSISWSSKTVEVEALEDGVEISGVGQLHKDHIFTGKLPIDLSVAGVGIALTRLENPFFSMGRQVAAGNTTRLSAFAGFAAVVVLSMLLVLPFTISSQNRVVASTFPVEGSQEQAAGDSTPPALEKSNRTAALSALKSRLTQAGLTSMQLSESEGAFRLVGKVDPAKKRRLLELNAWFDETYGSRIPLMVSFVESSNSSEDKIPAVEAVWTGKDPHLLMRGVRYGVGSELRPGWTVVDIQPDKVILKHKNEEMTITY